MLRHWIHNLRRKPKAARERIAVGVAGGVTSLTLVVWLMTSAPTGETFATIVADSEEATGAFSVIFEQIQEQTASVFEAVPEAPTTTESTTSSEAIASLLELTATTTTETEATATTSEPATTPRVVRIATTSASATTPGE